MFCSSGNSHHGGTLALMQCFALFILCFVLTTLTVTSSYSLNVCLPRISLIRNCEKLPAQEHLIVQEYLDKPFLMEGYKFDLRIYILVTSCDPLRIFLYKDGLVRMGTEKYHAPTEANLVSPWG